MGYPHFGPVPFLLCKPRSFVSETTVRPPGPDWNLGQFWTGASLTCCQDSTETAELKTCHGQCAVQAYSENTCQKTSGYVLLKKTTWTYLTEPLSWFLFTPHSSWGCRKMAQQQTQQRMDRWTQEYAWTPLEPPLPLFPGILPPVM